MIIQSLGHKEPLSLRQERMGEEGRRGDCCGRNTVGCTGLLTRVTGEGSLTHGARRHGLVVLASRHAESLVRDKGVCCGIVRSGSKDD